MNKGDIVLIRFPFTDLSATKLRPGVVLIASDSDLTVCFITSQLHWQESTDLILQPRESNGIKKISLIRTNKIATLDRSLILGKIGSLESDEIASLNKSLKTALQLN